MSAIHIDLTELQAFVQELRAAGAEAKDVMGEWLDELGEMFLDEVQSEIIARNVVNTGKLFDSFEKGGADNVWVKDGLTLEVGTDVDYASYVEYGHRQTPGRFIPGVMSGGSFQYQPGAKTGMVLKAGFVEGKHFFDGAATSFDPKIQEFLEGKMAEWLASHFG